MSDTPGRIESLYHVTLAVGARIGVCEIVARSSAGEMGDVYEAPDTGLDRIVSFKGLSFPVASGAQVATKWA